MTLTSSAFGAGATIPQQYTCKGADESPALEWSGSPAKAATFAMIMDDPDAPAGTWVHWVVFNLPASARNLPEHVRPGASVPGGGKQGSNDFGTTDYGGPCPPPGKPHRYYFRLFALDSVLKLPASAHRKDVDAAMKGHIVAHAELMGIFGR